MVKDKNKICTNCKLVLKVNNFWYFGYDKIFCSEKCRNDYEKIMDNSHASNFFHKVDTVSHLDKFDLSYNL